MTDHKALIAEARLYDNTGGLMGAPGSPNAKLCDLIRRLAAALEEATPPAAASSSPSGILTPWRPRHTPGPGPDARSRH